MKKPSMSDIAREAGVGVATVDRVLNHRAPVRDGTRKKVLQAAERLGYGEELFKALLREEDASTPPARMGFILLSQDHSFYRTFAEALSRAATQRAHPAPEFLGFDIEDVERMVLALESLAQRVDIIGVVALDHPLIRHTIKKIAASGVRVYALFSDFSPCGHAGYIGLDNQKAGRTAGWFAHRLLDKNGVIGVLLGDHRFSCQESCEIGFRSYLRENNNGYVVLEPLKTHESEAGGYAATQALLSQHPDLSMIYAPCGGIEGVIAVIKESGRRNIRLLCHGPVANGELALIDGDIEVMIRHPLNQLAETIVHAFINDLREPNLNAVNITVPFELITRENM